MMFLKIQGPIAIFETQLSPDLAQSTNYKSAAYWMNIKTLSIVLPRMDSGFQNIEYVQYNYVTYKLTEA